MVLNYSEFREATSAAKISKVNTVLFALGPALITTQDAGDAIILLKSLAASTFDSSQLVLTACMGFQNVTEEAIEELRQKHRPTVLAIEERKTKSGRICENSEGPASIRYSFNNEHWLLTRETKFAERLEMGRPSNLEKASSNLEEFLNTLYSDSEVDSLPYLQEQVKFVLICNSILQF